MLGDAGAATGGSAAAAAAPPPRRSLRFLAWLLPPLLWFGVFMLIPYGYLFYYALGSIDPDILIFRPGFSLHNLQTVLTVEPYLPVILRSIGNGALTALFTTLLALPLALFMRFSLSSARSRQLVSFLVIMPWWASYLVKAYCWKAILGAQGVLNQSLLSLGMIGEPLSLLLYNRFSVVLVLVYLFTPFAVLSIHASLERVPNQILDAARDLGASPLEILVKIILPLITPGIIAGAVVTFSLAFGDFVAPVLVGGPSDLMINNVVINLMGGAVNKPLGSAAALVIILLATGLALAANRLERATTVRM